MSQDAIELIRAYSSYKIVAFNRCYVDLTGGVTSALLLSQSLYWQGKVGEMEWWWKTAEQWDEEIGLTRYQLEGARTACCEKKMLQHKLKGTPAISHYRVYYGAVVEGLKQLIATANKYGGKPQTGLVETPKHVHRKTANYNNQTTAEITQRRALRANARMNQGGKEAVSSSLAHPDAIAKYLKGD